VFDVRPEGQRFFEDGGVNRLIEELSSLVLGGVPAKAPEAWVDGGKGVGSLWSETC